MAFTLSKEFIETLVSEPISDFSIKKGSKPGDNVASDLLAIQVRTESNQTLHLVYKSLPSDPEQRGWVKQNNIFRVETAIYKGFVPAIEKLLKKSKFGIPDPAYIPLPKCYASYNDDENENDYLCLEDLRESGFVMPDKFLGLNNGEVSVLLKELGKFHALGFYLIKYEGEKFFDDPLVELLASHQLWNRDKLDWDVISKVFGGSYYVAVDMVRERDPDLADKMLARISDKKTAGMISKETALKTDSEYFPVILHGDLWTNNCVIKYKEPGDRSTATAVKFLDFQQSRRGCIYEDLHYFFLTSTTPAERSHNWTNWADVYYDAFMGTVRDVGCPCPQNFSRGYFIDELWKSLLPGYIYTTFAIPFQLGDPVLTPEDLAEPKVTITCVDDSVNEMLRKFRKWMDRSPRAVDRLIQITEEFVQLGII